MTFTDAELDRPEIVWDAVEATYGGSPMTGGGTVWDPETHLIVDSHWVETLRSNLLNPDLFLYYNCTAGNFVLSSWIYRPEEGNGPGLMTEVEVIGPCHPDHIGICEVPHLDYLRLRCCPAKEMQDRVASKVKRIVYDRRKDMEDDAVARKEYAGHLRRNYMDQSVAKSIENGAPWCRPDKIDEEEYQKYVRIAKDLL